jgi:hypothetical protein
MEIQGVSVPLDVLKYITAFIYFDDDRKNLKCTCRAFARAFTESPLAPHVRLSIQYAASEGGIVTKIRRVTCYWKNLVVSTYPSNTPYLTVALKDGGPFILQFYKTPPIAAASFSILNNKYWNDWDYVCAKTGRIGEGRVLLNPNHDEIIRGLLWIRGWLPRELRRIYDQLNKEKSPKHKRTRKRVKRLGLDED